MIQFDGNVDTFRSRVKEILASCDLETTSSKTVRLQLEKEYAVQLKAYKKEIDALVVDVLNSISEKVSSESENAPEEVKPSNEVQAYSDAELAKKLQMEEDKIAERRQTRNAAVVKKQPKKRTLSDIAKKTSRKSGLGKELGLSQPLQDLVGVSKMSRPQVVKSLWQYIKEKNLQDERDKRFIICDEALSKIFQGRKRVGAFKMNQFLSSHLYPLDDEKNQNAIQNSELVDDTTDEERDNERINPRKVPRKAAQGGFTAMVQLSEPLADLLFAAKLPRTRVVKKIWEYVKEKKLQDPADKRFILCDEKMQAVFKTERVHMFTMNKAS